MSKKKTGKDLTERQSFFCREYLKNFNGTQAAIRAGYSKKTARSIAAENLIKPNIQAYLAGMIQKQAEVSKITVTEIIRDLKILKDRCMQACQVLDKKGNPTGEWQFDSAGANRSLELLGKHLAMFTDKFQAVDKDLHITVTMVDVKHVRIQVQQVITHHVSDPKVRDRIARELEEINE